MSAPKVSVVIPTFNRSTFLRHTIASVLAQTYPDFELVISDDASTDETTAVVRTFQDSRIKSFQNERRLGMVPNWNAAIRRARGPYITLLEDDDWWHPEYVARAVGTLDRYSDIAFMHTAVFLTDAQGRVTRVFKRWRTDRVCQRRTEILDLVQGNKIYLSTVMVRRSVIETVGLFDERIPYTADWDMWLRAYTYYDGAYVAEPLLFKREHDASVTRQLSVQPAVLIEDHRYVGEKTLRRIGEVYEVGFARRVRKLIYHHMARWRADVQAHQAWQTYLNGKFEEARYQAALALQSDPLVTSRFPLRLLFIALSKVGPCGLGRSIAGLENRLGRWLARHLPSVFHVLP